MTPVKPIPSIVDGENNKVEFDVAYSLKRQFTPELEAIQAEHGDDLCLLPLSGTSCGGGILQSRNSDGRTIVGLQFAPPASPRVSRGRVDDLAAVELDQIIVDAESRQVFAGASVTLGQLNQGVGEELGSQFRVLGADLTSFQYAAVGATFMTGGMGPQRRYFSDSVSAIALYDGEKISVVEGNALKGHAATYGWSGIVTAVCCRIYETPVNEIAFAMPVRNQSRSLARLLDHLAPLAFLNLGQGRICSPNGGTDTVFGIEHVTTSSMGPLIRDSGDTAMGKRARQLADLCQDAGADGLVFINGFSDQPADEFLLSLVDDLDSDRPTIAGIDLEHTEIFSDPEEMRNVREAIPYAARTQAPSGKHVFKNHTDATVRLNPDHVGQSMESLWKKNETYVQRIETLFDSRDDVEGEILVYGHLNPYGVDPHNRITFSCEDELVFKETKEQVLDLRDQFYRDLIAICDETGSMMVGGEKGADSERGIYRACGGPDNAPLKLREKFTLQQQAVRSASTKLNWRALPPYGE